VNIRNVNLYHLTCETFSKTTTFVSILTTNRRDLPQSHGIWPLGPYHIKCSTRAPRKYIGQFEVPWFWRLRSWSTAASPFLEHGGQKDDLTGGPQYVHENDHAHVTLYAQIGPERRSG
jgi:hypothetical protein